MRILFYFFSISILYACTPKTTLNIDSHKTVIRLHPESEYLVILVHGSGKQDIEGTVTFNENSSCEYQPYGTSSFKIFNELSEGFFQNGFSTVRYEKLDNRNDKRQNFLVKDYIQDLSDLLQSIDKHPLLTKKKIVLFGWSEGVTVALNQLKDHKNIHAVIGFGGQFVDPILTKANCLAQSILSCEGNKEKAIDFKQQFITQARNEHADSSNLNHTGIALVETIRNGEQIIGERKNYIGISTAYLQDFTQSVLESNEVLRSTKTPVLLVFGDKDINVPIENYQYLARKAYRPWLTLELLDNTDHLIRKDFNTSMNNTLFDVINTWKHQLE